MKTNRFQQASNFFPRTGCKLFTRQKAIKWIGLILLASCLAGAQFNLIQESFEPFIDDHVQSAKDVVDGIPAAGNYQSRILGPFMVEAVHQLVGLDFRTSYQAVTFVLLVAFFLIIILVARSIWRSTFTALGIAVSAGFLCTVLMQGKWLYLWDYINIILSALLIWSLLFRKSLWIICLIITIGFLNHQIILIVCIWLVLDSTVSLNRKGKFPSIKFSFHWRQLLLATGLLIFGYFTMIFTRDSLLITETEFIFHVEAAQRWGVDGRILFGHFCYLLEFNLDLLKDSFLFDSEFGLWEERFKISYLVLYNLLILAIPVIAVWSLFSLSNLVNRIGLLFLLVWSAIFITTPMYEMRVWLPFVPFLSIMIPIIYATTFSRSSNLPGETPQDQSIQMDNRLMTELNPQLESSQPDNLKTASSSQ